MADRSDIREMTRDYLYEASADLFSDVRINRAMTQTTRELPRRGIYLEKIYRDNFVVDQIDYTLPTGIIKVELVQKNVGTTADPVWDKMTGWDVYNNALYFREKPTDTKLFRIHTKIKFSEDFLADDVTATDIPDNKLEVLVAGTSFRCYKMLIGYLVDAKNWDALAKPDGISLNQVNAWITQARQDYKDLINAFKTTPRPRDIDLVG